MGWHGLHCSSVAFLGDDILVAASVDHFAAHGTIYRRPIRARQTFMPVGGGLPREIEGIADTRCVATRGSTAAIADRGGNVYLSTDTGQSWLRGAHGLPPPSSVVIA